MSFPEPSLETTREALSLRLQALLEYETRHGSSPSLTSELEAVREQLEAVSHDDVG